MLHKHTPLPRSGREVTYKMKKKRSTSGLSFLFNDPGDNSSLHTLSKREGCGDSKEFAFCERFTLASPLY